MGKRVSNKIEYEKSRNEEEEWQMDVNSVHDYLWVVNCIAYNVVWYITNIFEVWYGSVSTI